MNEEVERRIEEAAAEERRRRQTQEFLQGLTKNDEIVRPVYNPEAFVMRDKYRSAAKRGELPRTQCRHPFQALQQYVDDDSARGGHPDLTGRPVNLFICAVCQTPLWLVDPWGEEVSDL